MSFTHVMKSGKTVTTANGVTTITKIQDGKQVTRTYDMNNMTSGTVVGGASHVKIGAGTVRVENRQSSGKPGGGPGRGPVGQGVPVGGIAGRANQRPNPTSPNPNPPPVRNISNPNRHVSNQFNITGSVIGQVAIGNKGPTVFNNETKRFNAGSSNVDYKITGGNFSQANVGGQAVYNNTKSQLTAGGQGGLAVGGKATGYTIQDLLYSDMVAENRVIAILRTGITARDFVGLLRKGHQLELIEAKLVESRGNINTMVRSMLQYDALDEGMSDSSDSD